MYSVSNDASKAYAIVTTIKGRIAQTENQASRQATALNAAIKPLMSQPIHKLKDRKDGGLLRRPTRRSL